MNKTVIGVCGKPCSGKSTLIHLLCPKSVEIIDCDKVAKTIVKNYAYEIRCMLGVTESNKIADIIFNNNLKYLQYVEFIWGIMKTYIVQKIEEATAENVIIDAPLLLESGMHELCDVVVQFTAKPSTREKWAAKRGWSNEELKRRDQFFTVNNVKFE